MMWNTAGHRGQRRADAEQQGDQPEVADRRVGQQALEIVLEQRGVGAEQQRNQTGAAHQPRPLRSIGQRREQSRQQEHARP